MEEIWKDISFNDLYQISNKGNFKRGNKLINGWIQNTGYKTVNIKEKKYSIHRLVAEAFIPNPENKAQVNHKDGNKLNNCVSNLEWVTPKENVQHAFKIGLCDNTKTIISSMKVRAKIILQYDLQGNYIKSYKGSVEAQNELNNQNIKVNARNIRSVCNGQRKTAGGFRWRYYDRNS